MASSETIGGAQSSTQRLGQPQGYARANAERLYKGRAENVARNEGIAAMLRAGSSWSQIQAATGCSRATVAKIAKRLGPGEDLADRAPSA